MNLRSLSIIASLLIVSALNAAGQSAATKVAIFESEAFFDPKNGISTLITAQRKLSAEMLPRLEELQKLGEQVERIRSEVRSASPTVATPEWLRDKNDEGSRILREIDFKQKEADVFRERRQRDLIDPEMVMVGREIIEFARKRSIDLLIDQSRFSGTIFPVSASSNITADFIKEFNARRSAVPIKE